MEKNCDLYHGKNPFLHSQPLRKIRIQYLNKSGVKPHQSHCNKLFMIE